ncbi:MAG: hypothetical protein LBJ67_05695 [Planctomycetaceae bacterium]|jgi:hypothetical protein|nr:hypothetical protein [Planctomycetaceae bacterium]
MTREDLPNISGQISSNTRQSIQNIRNGTNMAVRTSADILKVNMSEELLGVVNDAVKSIPEIGFFQASPCIRNDYKSLAISALPATGFRSADGMRAFSTATLVNRTTTCKYLDASWTLNQAVAEQSDWGKAQVIAIEQMTHLQSAFFTLAKQIWYGVDSDASGFVGLSAFIDAVPAMIVNTPGTAATTDLSSVFAVRTGLDSCQIAWGSEGHFDEGEIIEQLVTNADGTQGNWVYAQKLGGWAGLQVTSQWAAARLKGLSTTTGKGLNDELLYNMLSVFPAGQRPDAFFMSRRSLDQLRSSRTTYSPTGAPAPIPEEVGGVPIFVTDAIRNDEENL